MPSNNSKYDIKKISTNNVKCKGIASLFKSSNTNARSLTDGAVCIFLKNHSLIFPLKPGFH